MSQIKRLAEQAIEDLARSTPEELQEVWDRVNPSTPAYPFAREHSIIASVLHGRSDEDLAWEYFLMRKCLREIEQFGHSTGHARGFTCANMAKAVLEQVNA